MSAVVVSAGIRTLDLTIPTASGWPTFTPLNGMVLAVLLMSRRRLWPFLLTGYVLALWQGAALFGAAHRPGTLSLGGNVAELLIAAFALPPYRNLKQWLLEPRLLRAFTAYALMIGPAVLGFAAAGQAAGPVRGLHTGFLDRARIVGFSEALGMALGCAVVLVLCNRKTYDLFHWRALPKSIGLYAMLGLTTWMYFSRESYPAVFLPYALLVTITFLLGLRGAVLGTALACAIIASLTTAGTYDHHGAFAAGSFGAEYATGQATLAQSCLALAVLTVFPLSVMLLKHGELEWRVADLQGEMDKLKSLDRLTGVASRKRFDLVLAREWQRASRDPKPVALLMIDTDFFELYNNLYGHQTGDQCLRLIAAKIAEQPHRAYDLVSRFEGGRFTVLLPGASGEAVARIAEEFRAEVASLEWPHEQSQFGIVTVSVGWASLIPEADLPPEFLIASAEQALAAAKKKGRNRVEGFTQRPIAMATRA
jgi:diguanylate cyclase (GGDEF)-like protein